jgi:phage shock protein A
MSDEKKNLDDDLDGDLGGKLDGMPGSRASSGRLDTDIGGMDAQAAHEYVLAFVTTMKQTQAALAAQEKELALWKERVKLASGKNETALAARAGEKVSQIEEKISTLKAEEADLSTKVLVLKDELKRLKTRFQASVDVDQLQAELDMNVGQPDTVAKSFKDQAADIELENLKKKMQGGS